jgi:basic amino acid/polyamine antiporter, APA family
MQTNSRDSGLVRVIGPWALAASAVSMIVGAGIFAVPSALAASVGPYGPLALLGCGIAVGAVAICFAEGGSRIPTSGGVYGFVAAAFGPLAGYVCGTLFTVGCVLACGGVAAALADVIASLVPPGLAALTHAAVIFGVIAGIALVNVSGVERAARLVAATTILKLVPLLIFIVIGAAFVHPANFTQGPHPQAQEFGRALILGVFAFIGMETPLCASGEVYRPSQTIPRALALTMVFTTALYVLIQAVAQGILGPSLASSKAPLADAMAHVHPLLRALMLAGGAISMFGYIGSDLLGSPRQLFAFARDGLLPSFLGRLHPRSHAPYTAILLYAAIAMLLAFTGTFAELAALSALAIAPIYIGGCLAAWVLARRGVALAGAPLNFRFLGVAASLGTASMLALVALGSRQEILGVAGLIALSILIYIVQSRYAPART